MRPTITLLTCLTVVSAAPSRWYWVPQYKDDVFYDGVAAAYARGGPPRQEGYDYDNMYTIGDVVYLPALTPTPTPEPVPEVVHVQPEPTPEPEPEPVEEWDFEEEEEPEKKPTPRRWFWTPQYGRENW